MSNNMVDENNKSANDHEDKDAVGENETEEEKVETEKEKKHDSGAADLERVTDYAEEKEILSSSTDLEDAINTIRTL